MTSYRPKSRKKKKHETEWLKQSDTSVLAHRDDFSHVKKEDVKKKRGSTIVGAL